MVKAFPCFVVLVLIVQPHNFSSDIKRLKQKKEARRNYVRLRWVGFVFLPKTEEPRMAKHRRFMSRRPLLFKRTHKGVRLMIYYLMTL